MSSTCNEVWRLVRQANDEHGVGASESEVLMITAILIFELEKIKIVVLEWAYATTWMLSVLVDVLASADLDHQAIFGHTMEDIVREKVRIARRGKPFVHGRQRYAEMVSAVRKVAGNVVDAYPVRQREWDASVDGDGQRMSALDDSFSFRASKSTQPRLQAVELIPSPDDDGGGGGHCLPDDGSRRMTVLADDAQNPASSTTLASYTSHLSIANATTYTSNPHRTIHPTYILAISDSPPKTPLQTLSHLLPLSPPSLYLFLANVYICAPIRLLHVVLEYTDSSEH
ncbi:uncharacterized protein STEHIDRAFT_152355 [Stereum hirsutum FP-91666 SS1]|uniref:uncharacterized protein n=1 Tax=Stereum hirsutum (strain FP-91666) TaxID=721885 RepID=UPI000440D5CC|nr:uncharacterized protein STEHIDRAFT_152355 [Stereum hirsutum FP-91666 SS1]EIM90643.1 hypothetical protein STEHIDRAFT_152355 [Stereum hirsutum FP-91666 SS1]